MEIYEKPMVIVAPNKDNGRVVYTFMMQGETWAKKKKLTAIYGELNA